MTSDKVESLRELRQEKNLDKKETYNEKDNCFVSVDIEFVRGSGL